ncbi:hypothetical protein [Flavobacterium sp.]|uniref:hypothetical protein n=1 Tax=Flavobacterium sp. TaxID=239 RepID=UPI0025B7C813|nr:hypothetical protein [Flavobacterium sp.]
MALIFLAAALVASCQYFDKPVPDKDELLGKELDAINWKEVDVFPSVAACDSVQDRVMQRQCFLDFLVSTIQEKLNADTVNVNYPDLDTIEVKVTIFPDSHVEFEPKLTDSLVYGKAKIDSILQLRLADFPKVKPALKRDIPVKTQFVLPVVLDVKK